MKKRMLAALAVLFLLLPAAGCSRYVSHYRALAFVRMDTGTRCDLSFSSLDGTYVTRVKNKSDEARILDVSAALQEGSMRVYFDMDGEKTLLFDTAAGQTQAELRVERREKVYLIIETDGKCRDGAFSADFREE